MQATGTPSPRTEAPTAHGDEYAEDSSDEEVGPGSARAEGLRPRGARVGVLALGRPLVWKSDFGVWAS